MLRMWKTDRKNVLTEQREAAEGSLRNKGLIRVVREEEMKTALRAMKKKISVKTRLCVCRGVNTFRVVGVGWLKALLTIIQRLYAVINPRVGCI